MVYTIRPLDCAHRLAIPSIQDRPQGSEHWRVRLREREPNPAVSIARPNPSVADEPAKGEAQVFGPDRGEVQRRRLSIPSHIHIRRPEGKRWLLGELSGAGLQEEDVLPGDEFLDTHPALRGQDLVIRGCRKLQTGLRDETPHRLHTGAPSSRDRPEPGAPRGLIPGCKKQTTGLRDDLRRNAPVRHDGNPAIRVPASEFRDCNEAPLGGHQRVSRDARVCRLHHADVGRRLPPVRLIDEEQPGLPVLPGLVRNLVEHLAGVELAHDLARTRAHEVVLLPLPHGLHEGVRDRDRDVEVRDLADVVLARDELKDVRVVHPEDSHVRPPPLGSLLHLLSRRVEDLHERHGPARDAHRRADEIVLRPQAGEGEAGSTAAVMRHEPIGEVRMP